MIKNFVAIDFETANNARTSVCSVGIVVVKNGVITQKFTSLINPTPNYYLDDFTETIHGISWEDTKNAPPFPDVWAEIAPIIGILPLVAHNKSFDEDCLRQVFVAYNMKYPDYTFYCTLQTARKKLPLLPNHKLETVSAHCGYDLINHHNALSDAEACAAIALQIL